MVHLTIEIILLKMYFTQCYYYATHTGFKLMIPSSHTHMFCIYATHATIPDCFFPCLSFVSLGKVWSKLSRKFFPFYLHFSFKWLVIIRRYRYHLYFPEKKTEAQIAYTNWNIFGVLSVLELYSTFYKPIVQLFTLTLAPSNVSD